MRPAIATLALLLFTGSAVAQTVTLPAAFRIHATLTANGVIVDGVSVGKVGDSSTVKVTPASQQAAAQPFINAFDWSDTAAQNFQKQANRTAATNIVPSLTGGPSGVELRAVAGVLVDEINALRQWDMSMKSCVASATSLATLQTCVAGLPTLSDRTLSQAQTAIQNKINAGTAD